MNRNTCGFTLLEILIVIPLMAAITSGLLFFLQMTANHKDIFQERSDIYTEAGNIMDKMRADLLNAQAVTEMEYFNDLNGDTYFNSRRPLPGFKEDVPISVDDILTTSNLREDFNPPLDDPLTTYFDESRLTYENLPYGIAYDYVFGITNSGNRDVLYFRGSTVTGSKRVPANICYRLVKKKLSGIKNEEDTGVDGVADEEEAGFHSVANSNPNADNFEPVFYGTSTEGNGILDPDPDGPGAGKPGERDQNGNGIIDSVHVFELQRIITILEDEEGDFGMDGVRNEGEPGYDPITNPDPNGDNFNETTNPNGTEGNGKADNKLATRVETLSNSVTGFNILYYDRQKRQYVEPVSTIKRFSYPPDVGLVGRFGTETPPWLSFDSMLTELSVVNGTQSSSIVSQGDYVFLRGTNIPFNIYRISEIDNAQRRIRFSEITSPIGTTTTVQFIPAGEFDASGMLSCPAVKDDFENLKAGDQIFLQQWNSGKTDFALKPDLYTIVDKRGGKLVLDLKGREYVIGTSTAFFRAAYLPPALKINLIWRADRISKNRDKPSYIVLSNTMALQN